MSSLNPTESENGAALVDIGASTTSVSIVKDNIVRDIGIIPFGGNNITNDIKNICCITFETAEKVKINFSRCVSEGSSDTKKIIIKGIGGSDNVEIPLSKLAKIIEARTSELFDAILYIIERCGYLDKIPAGIVITGGGAYSEHISQLARALCGVPIRIGNCMGTIDDKSPESCYDTYASSIVGALIQSYENYSMYEDRLSDAIVVNRSSNEPKLFDDHFSNEDNTAPDNTLNDDKDNTIDSRDKGKSEGGGIFKGLKGLFGNRNKQKEDDPKKSGNFMESIFGGKYNDEV
jgi:cell division protein FtsA